MGVAKVVIESATPCKKKSATHSLNIVALINYFLKKIYSCYTIPMYVLTCHYS